MSVVVLNGIPGSGKTTLARAWARGRRGTLVIDIDEVRAALPGWRDDPTGTGQVARAITLAAAREQLRVDGAVIIPQYLGRVDFCLALDDLVQTEGGRLVEVALIDELDETIGRFAARPLDEITGHAAEEIRVAGGRAALAGMAVRLQQVIGQRPGTIGLRTHDQDIPTTVGALDAVLGLSPPSRQSEQRDAGGPRLIVLTGMPDQDRTQDQERTPDHELTIMARDLARAGGGVLLDVAALKNALHPHGLQEETVVHRLVHVLAGRALDLSATVIIDASTHPQVPPRWQALAAAYAVRPVVINTADAARSLRTTWDPGTE